MNCRAFTRVSIVVCARVLAAVAPVVASAQQAPELVFDPTWPKDLPNLWKLGGVTGLARFPAARSVSHRRTCHGAALGLSLRLGQGSGAATLGDRGATLGGLVVQGLRHRRDRHLAVIVGRAHELQEAFQPLERKAQRQAYAGHGAMRFGLRPGAAAARSAAIRAARIRPRRRARRARSPWRRMASSRSDSRRSSGRTACRTGAPD